MSTIKKQNKECENKIIYITIMILSFLTDVPGQTVQT